MEITVKTKRLGISPRKVRMVCDLVRGKKADVALKILRFNEKKEIALAMAKLINCALAQAASSKSVDLENLYIKSIFADEGTMLKRVMPRAQGRAYRVRKRTSHLTLSLGEK